MRIVCANLGRVLYYQPSQWPQQSNRDRGCSTAAVFPLTEYLFQVLCEQMPVICLFYSQVNHKILVDCNLNVDNTCVYNSHSLFFNTTT